MPALIHSVEQNTPEWLRLREGLITASNAHTLLTKGANAARAANKANSSGGGYWANRGHELEDEAIEIYRRIKDVDVMRPGFITNSDYPACGYSPDGYAGILIEVKAFKDDKHIACLSETPTEVYAQCQFGMMIAECSELDLIHYNPDLDNPKLCYKVIRIERDERLIRRFEEKLGLPNER